VHALYLLEPVLENILDVGESLRDAVLGNLEYLLLGPIQQRIGVLPAPVALPGDLGGGADELAEQVLVENDLRVVLDVRRGGNAVDEIGEVRDPPDLLEAPRLAELFGERHDVDRLAAHEERDHRAEDGLVGRTVERIGRDELDGPRRRLRLEEHPPEHGALGLERLRRHPSQ
jgi:hypothetical protein